MSEVKSEIPSITNLATTTALNAKTNEAKKRLSITNLVTTNAFPVVEKKKLAYSKYNTTPDLKKSAEQRFAQASSASKNVIASFVKKTLMVN